LAEAVCSGRIALWVSGEEFVRWRWWICVALLCVTGCRQASTPAASVKKYAVRGSVMSVNPGAGAVDLDTEAIPGFMEAMTMSYKLADPTVISELHAGDRIAATLLCDAGQDGAADGCASMRLTDIVVTAQARPDYKPAMQYHVPAAGDAVPDFRLLNQSGKTISFAQFKGKVLVMTFVYTRCPLSDYCPRMSRNFAEIDKDLNQDKKLYAQTHLLTVSFDPAYDTPAVLKSYGEAYTGRYTAETFAHWDFAAPAESEVKPMEEFFDLGVTPGGDGSLQHSLSTLVIGKDGRVLAFYPTKDWDVKDVESVIRKAAA
jgi:protein SCO1/2